MDELDGEQQRTRASTKSKRTVSVDAFMADLAHPRKAEVELLRSWILGADPRVSEAVKWNAPSFAIDEHFATMRLAPKDTLQVVFHTGAKKRPDAAPVLVDDPTGMLTWPAEDRAVAVFPAGEDLEPKKDAFLSIVRQWIAQVTG